MFIYEIIFIICIGLIIGSFLNVCIYRLPVNQSVVSPPSHCFACDTRLKIYDLIPVFSYIWLRGRCRYCGVGFSARYVGMEVLSASFFAWCYMIFGWSFFTVQALIGISFLLIIAFIDYDHQLILDKVLIWFAGSGVLINLFLDNITLVDMLIACLAGGGILFLIALLTKGGMGGGDIKFMAALGLWLGLKLTLLTLFLSFVIGGIGSLLLLAFNIKGRKDFIPFGPFIAVAAFISMLYGQEIIDWYLSLL